MKNIISFRNRNHKANSSTLLDSPKMKLLMPKLQELETLLSGNFSRDNRFADASKNELERLVFRMNQHLTTDVVRMFDTSPQDPLVSRVFNKVFDLLGDTLLSPQLALHLKNNSVILINTIQSLGTLIENSIEYRSLFMTKARGVQIVEALK